MTTFGQVLEAMDKRFPDSPSNFTQDEREYLQNRPLKFPPELNTLLEQFVNRVKSE